MSARAKKTRQIQVGGVPVGGGAPVAVQSMTKTATEDVRATVRQIRRLQKAGCEIIRCAVPHKNALRALPEIRAAVCIPLIADIHFSSDLAMGALEQGADCIRINPGNIGGLREFAKVARAAVRLGRAVRIGVNAGSLSPDIARKKSLSDSDKLVHSALRFVEKAEQCGLREIKVSLKSFDVPATVAAYRSFSGQSDAPLHIGITEAGDAFSGAIRSAVGLGILLEEGIGDTLRVSLTAPPEKEVAAAWEILGALELRRRGLQIVSCPTCGRCGADLGAVVRELRARTRGMDAPVRVAVMGCEVNGPGEARSADLGVAMTRSGSGVLFIKGKKIRKLARDQIVPALIQTILEYQ